MNRTKDRTFISSSNNCLNGTIKVQTIYKIMNKVCHSNQAPQTLKPLQRTDSKKIFINYKKVYSKLKVKIQLTPYHQIPVLHTVIAVEVPWTCCIILLNNSLKTPTRANEPSSTILTAGSYKSRIVKFSLVIFAIELSN